MSRVQPLRARTYLGDNSVAIVEHLCSYLSAVAGVEVVVAGDSPGTSPDASDQADDFDLVWACGLLTSELMAARSLDAEIVAVPVFTGESKPVYHSVVVAHPRSGFTSLAEASAGRLAVNEEESWSGHHGLLVHMQRLGVAKFADIVWSGSHRDSALVVLAGDADVAAIDNTVWQHLVLEHPDLAHLQVIDRTTDWPAPPFTVHRSIEPATRARLIEYLTRVGPGDVDGLERIDPATAEAYSHMHRL